MARDPNCEKCILNESSKHVCIWGHGEGEAFVVGEAPGREEGRTGRPFMGKAGMFGRPILKEYGLEDPYITNAVKCRPPDNRKPEPDELKACKPYLLDEIAERKPKAILLWGAIAMRQLLGRTGITEMNGQVIEKDGQTYVPCFHPAYVLRDPSKEPAFRMAVARYASVLKGTHSVEKPKWQAIEQSTFDEFLRDWIACDEVQWDTESAGEDEGEGLEFWKDTFCLTAITFSLNVPGVGEKNWGLALPGHPKAVVDHDIAKELLTELTRTCGGKRVGGHNVKHDNIVLLAAFGVRFPTHEDSMLAHHLIDENSAHGLKILARQYLGAPDYELTRKEILDTRKVPIRKLLEYGCGDSAYSRQLVPVFRSKMDEQEEWLYRKVVIPASRLFEQAELDGHFVDVDFLNKVSHEEFKKLKEVEAKLNKIAKREVNWNSPSQVAEVLYRDLGIIPTVFTDRVNPKTGAKDNPSTSEAALIDIDHPIAKLLEQWRGHDKFLSTYAGWPPDDKHSNYHGGWRNFMRGPHLYISTKIHGTVTGRYSSRLHSTPRDSTIRGAIGAPPGWTFVQGDLSQAELRVIAIISRDPEMLRIFLEGKDIHWFTLMDVIAAGGGDAELVMKTVKQFTKRKLAYPDMVEFLRGLHHDEAIQLFDAWKEWRKKAKGVNFGFAYGQSATGFIDYAKLKYDFEPTLEESTLFRNSYFNRYIALSRWHERQKQLVRSDGFVRSMSGRKRRLPGIYSPDRSIVAECERQAINSPVQGFIGDYKAMIMVELAESFPHTHLRVKGEQHDSILMWIRTDALKSILPAVHHIMEHPKLAKEAGLKFPIPMLADIEVGRWGAGKKWKGVL